MSLIGLLTSNPLFALLLIGCLILALSFHEFAHAYVAYKLGDDTPYLQGRVTLNPLAHLDPIGTLLLLVAGFGWGKPVITNPYNLQNYKRDVALISFAGPAVNFLLAIFSSILLNVVFTQFGPISSFLSLFAYFNILLGVFNLLPIAPLDGFKVVMGVLPDSLVPQWMQLERFGLFILLGLLLTDAIPVIISPVISAISNLLML
jgi:Zn-dependent protease